MISLDTKISKYFTWREALFLPSWNIYHDPTDEEKTNIVAMAISLDAVRDMFKKSVHIHCWIRPILRPMFGNSAHTGQDYNAFVKGAIDSGHINGNAADFDLADTNCDEARTLILPKLDEWNLRMEDRPKSNWIHLDRKAVITQRFFKA